MIYVGSILTHIRKLTTLSVQFFQNSNILYSGTPKTNTLTMRKTANKKAPIAPNLKPSDIFKCGLHTAITDGIPNTKK